MAIISMGFRMDHKAKQFAVLSRTLHLIMKSQDQLTANSIYKLT